MFLYVAHVPVETDTARDLKTLKDWFNSCDVVLFPIFFKILLPFSLLTRTYVMSRKQVSIYVFVWPCVFLFDVLHGQHSVFMRTYDEIYIAFQVIIRYKIFSNTLYLLCVKPGQGVLILIIPLLELAHPVYLISPPHNPHCPCSTPTARAKYTLLNRKHQCILMETGSGLSGGIPHSP